MTHELKTYPKYFQETIEGNKPFEIRKNDRNFQVGVDGSDKVNDLKNQIAIAKENKNLSKVQRDKIIANSKKELESAKRVKRPTKKKSKS